MKNRYILALLLMAGCSSGQLHNDNFKDDEQAYQALKMDDYSCYWEAKRAIPAFKGVTDSRTELERREYYTACLKGLEWKED